MDKLSQLSNTLKPSPLMPVLFVGHGNPMNAILDNDITRTWHKVGQDLPVAQAIVVISAHWLTDGTFVTDAPKQTLIYDMYGFPNELYEVKYPAIGSPEIAKILTEKLIKYEATLDSTWGLDHGTWSVLKHLAPEPKVPILQISLDITQSLEAVVELFRLLKPLREKGVIFIGSGNLVHNLRQINWQNDQVFDWSLEFDSAAAAAISNHRLDLLTNLRKISNASSLAVPTDDHYRPMLAAMALLENSETLNFFNNTIDMGSISMRSFITN